MTQKLLSVGAKFTTLLLAAVLTAVSFTSCTKTAPSPANAKFVSDWIGSTTCWDNQYFDTVTTPDQVEYIGAETDGNLIKIGTTFGLANCSATYPVEGTVNGTKFAIAPQNFTDNCGVTYLISGNGALSASGTLTVSTTVKLSYSTTCIFTGVKQ
jgi:hypothetical protein